MPHQVRSLEETELLNELEAAPSTYHLVQRLVHEGRLYLVDKGQGLVYSNNLEASDAEPMLLGTWSEDGGFCLKEVVAVSKVSHLGVDYLVDKDSGCVYSSTDALDTEPEIIGGWTEEGGVILVVPE
jgi:hypothetical protein